MSDTGSSHPQPACTGIWSQQSVLSRLNEIVAGSNQPPEVKQGAIELRMGCEAFVTGRVSRVVLAKESDEVVIPPGQFALLLTDEKVSIPLDSIGFMSIKFGLKVRGLVNVSGFHVDPGFCGWLTFSVYNAGPAPVVIRRLKPVFLLWLAKLDKSVAPADGYSTKNNSGRGQAPHLDDELIMNLQGEIASPGELRAQFGRLREELDKVQSNQKVIITIVVALFVAVLSWTFSRQSQSPGVPSPMAQSPAPSASSAVPAIPATKVP